eukprot:COSAG03_NODE_18455_length_354_cov_1.329412_1_plen_23_part_10
MRILACIVVLDRSHFVALIGKLY